MHRYIPISIPDDFYIGGRDSVTATIDSDIIDSTLPNFPVGIEIGDIPFMADRSATDWQNLHCTVGGTECYVEVDVWDVSTPQAILHVKVASVSSSADTVIDIRFGADNTTTYVGETGDTAAQNVWDSNFVAVYHMSQDPSGGSGAILDSTSNANNGTSAGTMTSGDLVDAGFGKAIDFDGTDDRIAVSTSLNALGSSNYTIESYNTIDTPSITDTLCTVFATYYNTAGYMHRYKTVLSPDGIATDMQNWHDTTYSHSFSNSIGVSFSTFFYGVSIYSTSTKNIDNYINATLLESGDYVTYQAGVGSVVNATNTPQIGCLPHAGGFQFLNGKLSELRLSNTARSAAWIKATNAVLAKTLVTLS